MDEIELDDESDPLLGGDRLTACREPDGTVRIDIAQVGMGWPEDATYSHGVTLNREQVAKLVRFLTPTPEGES